MLVDTNILVHSINADSPRHRRAQQFIKFTDDLVITHQNIFEALRVLTHPTFPNPMKIQKAVNAVLSISDKCQIIIPNQETHYLALELIKKHNLSGNRIFDAYLVATALSNDITDVATDNVKDFQKFSEIEVINPFKE